MAFVRDLKGLIGAALAGGLLLAAPAAFAQAGPPGCTRAELQQQVDDYLATQTTGDWTKLHFTLWARYTENGEEAAMSSGVVTKPMKVDFHRSLLDTAGCSSFTEVVITDPAHPYVLGVRISGRGGQVNSIDMLATDHDKGWLFNAANTMKYSAAEKWTEIPPAERDSRDAIMAAANAYLDLFDDKTVQVPWGTPCARLEGGLYTGKGAPGVATPEDSCNVGVPSGQKMVDRTYVVDEALGSVAVFLTFGTSQLPDIHTFRVEHGKLRYVHTITVCKTYNCGFKMPDQLQAKGG